MKPWWTLLLLWASGCAGRVDLTFRTIDGRTGEPVGGVDVTGVDESIDILFGVSREELPVAVTDADGVVHVRGVHRGWVQRITFVKAGCLQRHAYRGRKEDEVLIDRRPDDPLQSKSFTSVGAVGVIDIRMYPEGTLLGRGDMPH